jgi:hypothetical protein
MIGIVPTAGRAVRFGGTLKELLPWEGGHLLGNTVMILQQYCENVVVITNPQKIMQHAQALEGYGVTFILQEGDNLLSGLKSVTLDSDYYLFAMPDTVFPIEAFPRGFDHTKFQVGLFNTTEGHRFGVFEDGYIDDKNLDHQGYDKQAWGLLGWPRKAMQIIRDTYLTEHTDALNLALRNVGYETFMMAYYIDLADFEEYKHALGR